MSIGKKIEELKGKMTYEDMAKDIYEKTGHEIHWTSLQKYITGTRTPSIKTLEILSQYAQKPLTFFVEGESESIRNKITRLEKLKDVKKEYKDIREKTGLSSSMVSELLSGKRKSISGNTLERLAQGLNVSIEELVIGERIESSEEYTPLIRKLEREGITPERLEELIWWVRKIKKPGQ